jgi:type I restriction enzyme S subunit
MVADRTQSSTKSPLGTVPHGWRVASTRDIAIKIGSGATPSGGAANYLLHRTKYALIRSQNVFDRYFDTDGLVFISDAQASELAGAAVSDGDVLLNITGDGITFGRACIAPRSVLPACVNQHVTIIRANKKICAPGYLLSYLTHPSIKRYIDSFNAGGSRRAITKGHIESFVVPLPPLAEQHAIAHILGTLDDKIELNRRMSETLEEMARALFKSWFVDFDPVHVKADGRRPKGMTSEVAKLFPSEFEGDEPNQIPAGWETRSLYDSAKYTNGAAYRDFDFNAERKGLPIIKIVELKGGITPQTKFTEGQVEEKYRIDTGSILFSWSGNPDTSIDTFVWTHGPAWLNQHIFKVEPNAPAERLYVFYLLKHLRPVFADIARDKQTTGLGHVTSADMKRMSVVHPPKTVLDKFNKIVAPIHDRWFANLLEISSLQRIRDELLPKLLSGELLIENPNAFLKEHVP